MDDDVMMLRMLEPRLAQLDVAPPVGLVVKAQTPEDALRRLDEAPEGPLAVLSDFNLKAAINGRQLLEQVRARRPDAARILISGYSAEQLGDLKSDGVVQEFIEKPMRIDEMLPPLARAIQQGLAAS